MFYDIGDSLFPAGGVEMIDKLVSHFGGVRFESHQIKKVFLKSILQKSAFSINYQSSSQILDQNFNFFFSSTDIYSLD